MAWLKNSYLLSFYFLFSLNTTFTRFPILQAPMKSSICTTLIFSLLHVSHAVIFSFLWVLLSTSQILSFSLPSFSVPLCWIHTFPCLLSTLQLTHINLLNSYSTTENTIYCGFISISHKLMCGSMLQVFYFYTPFCIEHTQNSLSCSYFSPCLFS